MYLLIEGMPCTGKTTISKRIAQQIGAQYMKSVVSDTTIGNYLKLLRQQDQKTLEYFHIVDSLIDELKVRKILDTGYDLVRDKCFVSSMAHLLTHGVINDTEPYKCLVWEAYDQLVKYSVTPDLVILMEPDIDAIKQHISEKKDLSDVDKMLLSNQDLYKSQHETLKTKLDEMYKDNVLSILSFNKTLDHTCQNIIYILKKRTLI